MKISLLLFCLLLITPVVANDVCQQNSDSIIKLLQLPHSRLAFKNQGGLLNKGVCWWHSRLQRSSAYLAQYNPTAAPPDEKELTHILNSLMWMNKVVTINGFSDFESFSRQYRPQIQQLLNYWQKIDGFFNFVWIRSISGNYQLEPAVLEKRMEDIYATYKHSPQPLWLMAQIKGITSHSLLLLGMKRNAAGFELQVIDSNQPAQTLPIFYQSGDRNLQISGQRYTFIPYVGFQKDFNKIKNTLNSYCGEASLLDVAEGEVELPDYLQY